MGDFLTEEDCRINYNSVIIAGKVAKIEPLAGKTSGVSFVLTYTKRWPTGGTSEIPVRCLTTGERAEQLKSWMTVGEIVLVRGEITNTGAVFAFQIERFMPEREPGEDDDAYLAGMSQHRKA